MIGFNPIAMILDSFVSAVVFPFILLTTALLAVIGSIGLLRGKNWGRNLCIFVAIVDLFVYPYGAALGIYALLVLFHPMVKEYYLSAARLLD